MPQMTGLELADAIKKEWPELPVMIATGFAEMEPETESSLPKLAKPFTEAELAKEIERIVPGKRWRPAAKRSFGTDTDPVRIGFPSLLALVIKHRRGSTMKLRVWCDRQPSKATRKTSLRHRADESENCGFLNGRPADREDNLQISARGSNGLACLDLPDRLSGDFDVESCLQKYFASPVGQIISTNSRHPTPPEGRIAIVTDAGCGCGGRGSVRRAT